MKQHRLFVNYRLLWREIQDSNKFEPVHSWLLRRGNSYVLYQLCKRYKDLLNQYIKEGKTIDADNLPLLYIGSSDMYKNSPYRMKSITNCLQTLMRDSYWHLITIKPIFNESKFKVSIPLRYFFTLGDISLDYSMRDVDNEYKHKRF
ncbi:hypothetical protein [Aquimarina latercula]|uniref:hypothetical protein n=1 Tax=Aquimarina latercula TaxID=987 RepID=UPI00040A8303|nr:hypothetical protein [Aquimarina latercula]